MSQSQRFDSHSQYKEPFPHPSAAVPAVADGQRGQARQERPPACQPRQSPPAPAEMRSRSVVTQDPHVATILLMVGLPGAGKTTRAKELAAANRALRLTPDHWMIPMFGKALVERQACHCSIRMAHRGPEALARRPSLVSSSQPSVSASATYAESYAVTFARNS